VSRVFELPVVGRITLKFTDDVVSQLAVPPGVLESVAPPLEPSVPRLHLAEFPLLCNPICELVLQSADIVLLSANSSLSYWNDPNRLRAEPRRSKSAGRHHSDLGRTVKRRLGPPRGDALWPLRCGSLPSKTEHRLSSWRYPVVCEAVS
jgi:hypothetical protein